MVTYSPSVIHHSSRSAGRFITMDVLLMALLLLHYRGLRDGATLRSVS